MSGCEGCRFLSGSTSSCAVFFTGIFLIVSACSSTPSPSSEHSLSEREINKAVVVRYMEARGTPAYDSLVSQILAADYREIRNEFENLSYNIQGEKLADMSQSLDQAILDRNDEMELVVAEGGTVAVRYRVRGVHGGNLFGIPATGKEFDIYSVAIFELEDGKIKTAWYMTDEVGLLRQLGVEMPSREDGQYRIPPTGGETALPSDDVLVEMLTNPEPSSDYRKKLKVAARKANNPPAGIIPASGRPYDEYLRPGFKNLTDIGNITGSIKQYPFLGAYPDRVDKIDYFIIDGDYIMIRFRLTATNTVSLFGLPASNGPVDAWEIAFFKFEAEHWKDAWWFGDDQAMLMQLGGPQHFWFPKTDIMNQQTN